MRSTDSFRHTDVAGGAPMALDTVVVVGKAPPRGPVARHLADEVAREVVCVPDRASTLGVLKAASPDLVIIREDIPPSAALDILRKIRTRSPKVPVVVVAGEPTVDRAVRFIRAGAYDYFGGPLDRERLQRLVHGMTAERSRTRRGRDRFFCENCPPDVPIVGRSSGMVKTLETIRLVAESRCNPILILGETGTGKELAARGVHAWRCGDPDAFVAVNCAALTANLLESELFGHVKGAFTGADREKTGLFELAGSGSILLDEISEMPRELQAKLLRVLQERTFRKVGGTRDITCNATVIASSNRDLLKEMEEGRFRRDLYYRLAVFPISLPPVRSESRRDDIPLLAEYFVMTARACPETGVPRLSKPAAQRLLQHTWPGNVRELRNVIERAMILEKAGQITPASLIIEPSGGGAAPGRPSDFSLETAEREFILRALKETGWQRTRAAALLGITRATLYEKLKRYDIQAPVGRATPASGSGGRESRRKLRGTYT